MTERLVAGVDSSTQSCKVVIREAETGRIRRHAQSGHAGGTEIDPEHWWSTLQHTLIEAGGLRDISALSVGGQQHGMIALDEDGKVIRPALLWNDTRSAQAARDLIVELGEQEHGCASTGAQSWADATGTVPVASLTVTKLRWLAEHEPAHAARVAAIALPHDWLTWRLSGSETLDSLVTDRSDASGTGYFDATNGVYRRDLLALALGRSADDIVLPRVLGPGDSAGNGDPAIGFGHLMLGPGAGDNAAAALGLGLAPGDVALSIGTSGVVSAVSPRGMHDSSGTVAGFADATGSFLPLVVTLNGTQVLDAAMRLLGVDHRGLSELVLQAAPGAQELTLVPYLAGERTPNAPLATGSLLGLTAASTTRANLARAAVEGLVCGLAEGLDAMRGQGVAAERISLIGGGARSPAVQAVASSVLGAPVHVPAPAEYVADGAARQAAWVLNGTAQPPAWHVSESAVVEEPASPAVRDLYSQRRHLVANRRDSTSEN